ncbi:O-antigen ligase family protein [Thermithiobacillus plumbiphilus]|uniref:O-antigen ligase family protein n=1 Tax=Thermithiobacillus plumbiphilus TaxID=1729899 RepID=A0ABU9DBA4_9PROT
MKIEELRIEAPFYALFLTAASIPISTAASSIFGGIFFAAYLWSGFWRRRGAIFGCEWAIPVLFLIVVNLAGLFWTEDLPRGFELVSKLHFFLYALLGITLPWNRMLLRKFVMFLLLGWLLNAAVGLLQILHLFPWRPMNPELGPIGYPHHGTLGLYLSFILIWLLFEIKTPDLLQRKHSIALAVIFFAQLAMTGGRIGQVLFLLALPLSVWILFPNKMRLYAAATGLLAMIAIGLSPQVESRFKVGVDDVKEYMRGNPVSSIGLRFVMWDGAFVMGMNNPLFGVGTGDYGEEMENLQRAGAIPQTGGVPFDNPHSNLLAYFSALGLIGLLVFLIFNLSLFKDAWKSRGSSLGWFKLSYYFHFTVAGVLAATSMWDFASVLGLGLVMSLPASVAVTSDSA